MSTRDLFDTVADVGSDEEEDEDFDEEGAAARPKKSNGANGLDDSSEEEDEDDEELLAKACIGPHTLQRRMAANRCTGRRWLHRRRG